MTYAKSLAEDLDCGEWCESWFASDGTEIHIHALPNHHLGNIIRLLRGWIAGISHGRNCFMSEGFHDWFDSQENELSDWLILMEDEAKRRGLKLE